MLPHFSQLIGYELDKAIKKTSNDKEIVIRLTQTPFKDKMRTRMDNKPIVIKHIENDKRVILTVGYFK